MKTSNLIREYKKVYTFILIIITTIIFYQYRGALHNKFNKVYNYYNLTYTNKLDSISIYANAYKLQISRYENYKYTNKTAGIIFDTNKLVIFEQNNINYLISYFKLDSLIKKNFIVNFYEPEPIKQIFKYHNNILALLIFNDKKSRFISIINCTKKFEIFRSENLPIDNFLDFNGIGGGFTEFENNLLIGIGVPSAGYNDIISELAQNDNSPFGKILIFGPEEIQTKRTDIFSYKIYSKGHRNPQGLFNLNNTIYEVEHGPRGGDELNIIDSGNNYGWPKYSFGKSYDGNSYKIPIDTLNYKSPIFSYIPSVATSDIIGCPNFIAKLHYPYDCLILSTLKAKSLFILIIDPKRDKLISQEQLICDYRIREFQREIKDSIIFSTDNYGVYKIDTLIFY